MKKRDKNPKSKKPRIAFFSLTCCEGCEFALLDLGDKFFALAEKIDIAEFHLIEEEEPKYDHYDISFVEGSPITRENFKVLKKVRQCSNFLVALGNCAHMGGIHDIKSWIDKEEASRYVYSLPDKVNNPDIRPIGEVVKVDFVLPGCPISGEEFLQAVYDLLAGKKPHIPDRPVCYECQLGGYDCLLQQGKPCLGPITLGGCGAVCLKSGQPCYGCRGIIKEANASSLMQLVGKSVPIETIERVTEVFGLKKGLLCKLNKKTAKQYEKPVK